MLGMAFSSHRSLVAKFRLLLASCRFEMLLHNSFHQLHRALLTGVVVAQLTAEGAGEDGFF